MTVGLRKAVKESVASYQKMSQPAIYAECAKEALIAYRYSALFALATGAFAIVWSRHAAVLASVAAGEAAAGACILYAHQRTVQKWAKTQKYDQNDPVFYKAVARAAVLGHQYAISWLAHFYDCHEQSNDAIEWFRQVQNPDSKTLMKLGLLYQNTQKRDEAIDSFAKVLKIPELSVNDRAESLAQLVILYANGVTEDDCTKGVDAVKKYLELRVKTEGLSTVVLEVIYSCLSFGQKDKALEIFQQAEQQEWIDTSAIQSLDSFIFLQISGSGDHTKLLEFGADIGIPYYMYLLGCQDPARREELFLQAAELFKESLPEPYSYLYGLPGCAESSFKWHDHDGNLDKATYEIAVWILEVHPELQETAIALLQSGAERGHQPAIPLLASLMYKNGKREEAEKWYREAAKFFHAASIYNLALILVDKGQIDEAIGICVQSRNRVEKDEQHLIMRCLGFLYEQQLLDEQQAICWYKQAADLGDVKAMVDLAELLLKVDKPNQAIKHFGDAINAGDQQAAARLSALFQSNIDLAKEAAKQEIPVAVDYLVHFYTPEDLLLSPEQAAASPVGLVTAESFSWYQQGYALKNPFAKYILGCEFLKRQQSAAGNGLLWEAATLWAERQKQEIGSDVVAMYFLANWIMDPKQSSLNLSKDTAEKLLRRGADHGHADSTYALAYYLSQSEDRQQEAAELFRKAAAAGSQEALAYLAQQHGVHIEVIKAEFGNDE